jgi:hypothetical protein
MIQTIVKESNYYATTRDRNQWYSGDQFGGRAMNNEEGSRSVIDLEERREENDMCVWMCI